MKFLHQQRSGHRTSAMRALCLALMCLAALRCAHASAFGDMDDLEAIKEALQHSDRSLGALELLLYNGSDVTAASSSSSVAPISTSENPGSTSENPPSTSEFPGSTSESPASTSESSVSTSESSVPTSESSVSTSESSVSTSESSVSTSESSVPTSESSVSTSESSVPTSESSVSTSESSVSTSESSVPTSESSVSTSESQESTSESPVSTSGTPVSTSESPSLTSESSVSTSESPVSTSESSVPTSESVSTSESQESTSESPVPTSESSVSTSESPVSTSDSSISTTSSLSSSSGSPILTTESLSSTNQPTDSTKTTETFSSTNEITAAESTTVETTTEKATTSSAPTTEAATDSTQASETTEPSLTEESTTTNGATHESSTVFVSTTKSTSPTTEAVTTMEQTAEQSTTPQSTTERTSTSESTTVGSVSELSRSNEPVSNELSEDSAMRDRLTSESSVPDLQRASQAFEPQNPSSSASPEREEIPDVTMSSIVIESESVYATEAISLTSDTNSVSLAPFDNEIGYSIQSSRSTIDGNPTPSNQNSVIHDTGESTENYIFDVESQENVNMSEVSSGSQQISQIRTAVHGQTTRHHVINQGAFTTEISETWTPQVGELRQHTNGSEDNEVYQNKRTTTRLKNDHDSIRSRRLLGFHLTDDKVGSNSPVKVLFGKTQAEINNFLSKENSQHPTELGVDIDKSKIGTNGKFDAEIMSSEQGWIPKNNMESDGFPVPVNDNEEYKESLQLDRMERLSKTPISDEDDVGFIMKDVMDGDHENINIIAEVWDKLRNEFVPEKIMKGIKIINLLRLRRKSEDSSENQIQRRSTNEEVVISNTADTQTGERSSRTNTTWADDVTKVLLMMNKLTTEIMEGATDNEHAEALDSQADALDKLVEEGSEDPSLIEGTQDELLLLVENTTQAVSEAVIYVDHEIEETQDDVTLLIVLITLVSLVIVSAIVGAVLYFTRPWSGDCTSPGKPFGRRSSMGIMDDISMDLKETVAAKKFASYSNSNFVNSSIEMDPFQVSEDRYSAPKTTNLDEETVNSKKKPSDPKLNSIKRNVEEFIDDQEYYGKDGAVVVIRPKQGVKLAQTLQSQNGSFAYDSVRSSVRNNDSMGKSSNKSNSLPKEATTRTQLEGRSLNAPASHEERRRKSEPYYLNMSTIDLSDED